MKIFAATNNTHKLAELRALFVGHEIVSPADFGIEAEPDENGKTFIENALIKAASFNAMLCDIQREFNIPVLADDSGLCVDSLGGNPGIFSARYSGTKPTGAILSQEEKNRAIIDEIPANASRKAHFACALVLYWSEHKFFAVQENVQGKIVDSWDKVRGDSGFGYDPIFIPDSIYAENGKTLAEYCAEEKNEISHRGKACKTLLKLL